MIVAYCGNPIMMNIPLIARASSFKDLFTAFISDSAVDVDKSMLMNISLLKLTAL